MGCGVLVYTAFPPFSQYPHPFPPAHRRPWRAGPSPDSPSPPHLWAGAAAAAAATAAAAPPPPSLRATMGGIGSLLAAARQRLPCRRATPTAAKIGAPAGAAPAATTPKPGAGAGNKAVMGALRSSTPQAEAKAAKAAAAAVTKTRTDAGAEPAAPATPAKTPRSAARRAKRAGAGASPAAPVTPAAVTLAAPAASAVCSATPQAKRAGAAASAATAATPDAAARAAPALLWRRRHCGRQRRPSGRRRPPPPLRRPLQLPLLQPRRWQRRRRGLMKWPSKHRRRCRRRSLSPRGQADGRGCRCGGGVTAASRKGQAPLCCRHCGRPERPPPPGWWQTWWPSR